MNLKKLKTATAQQVADHITEHLLTQNARSTLTDNDLCMYRTDDGRKCAAGCLISDDEYSHDMESEGWLSLAEKNIVPDNHELLIEEFQVIHDEKSVEYWPEEIKAIYSDFNLTQPEILRDRLLKG